MKRLRALRTNPFDTLAIVVSGIVTIYFLGFASASGQDPFYPLLAAFGIMLALLAREFLLFQRMSRFYQPLHPLAMALGLFALGLVLSATLVDLYGLRRDQPDIYRQTAMLLVGMAPFVLAYRIVSRQGVGDTIEWIAHAVMAICTISIGLEAVGLTSYETYGDRHFGFLSDPSAMMMTLPVLVYGATRRRILVAIALVVLLLTISRGPIAYALAGLLALAAFGRGKARTQAFALIGIGSIMAVSMGSAVTNLTERFDMVNLEDGRVKTSLAGLRLFSESPLFGQGYAALGYHFPKYDNGLEHVFGRYRDGVFPTATSTWAQVLSDGGMLLAIAYFILIGLTAYFCLPRTKVWLSMPRARALAGASMWLIIIFFLNHSAAWLLAGGPIAPLVMCLLGIVTGALAYERREMVLGRYRAMRRPGR